MNAANQEYCKARDLEHRLQTSDLIDRSGVLDLMRKMVYQQFTLQVIQQLPIDPNLQEAELQQGRQGLSFDIISNLLGQQPYLVHVRKGMYKLGNTYPERVQGLFSWDDDIPRTFWDQCYYRQLARKFHKCISACISPADAENWKDSLGRLALPYFWIIPHYNKHSLFTRLAKSANRPAVTRPFISGVYKWKVCDDDLDPCNEKQWLLDNTAYMEGYPDNFTQPNGSSLEDAQVDALDTQEFVRKYAINFGCAVPFTEIPEMIEAGFEAYKEIFKNGDVKVLAHYLAARDCLEQCLGDPICDLLMIVLTFASSSVTPIVPQHSYEFDVGPRKEPKLLAVNLTTRMLWFLRPGNFPWDEDDGMVLRIPEMMKKMGGSISQKHLSLTVGSHSSHVPYARDLCEARIYAADTASEEESSIHQESTPHTYHYK